MCFHILNSDRLQDRHLRLYDPTFRFRWILFASNLISQFESCDSQASTQAHRISDFASIIEVQASAHHPCGFFPGCGFVGSLLVFAHVYNFLVLKRYDHCTTSPCLLCELLSSELGCGAWQLDPHPVKHLLWLTNLVAVHLSSQCRPQISTRTTLSRLPRKLLRRLRNRRRQTAVH